MPTTANRLERRYSVQKVNDPNGKHDECRYFVLDPQHDAYAATALRAYAEAVGGELASDIGAWLRALDYCPGCSRVRGHRGAC